MKITKLQPGSQKDTFVTLKLMRCLLFSTIKKWRISKSDLTILSIPKEMDAGLWMVFSSLNAMKLVTQNYQKKCFFFEEIPVPKKVPLLKK